MRLRSLLAAAGLALLVLAGFGTAAASGVLSGTGSASVGSLAAADTTVVYGPKLFYAANSTALHVEQFSTTRDTASAYYLEVVNGAPSGSDRVRQGQVKLNGVVVVDSVRFAAGFATETRRIDVADGTNTLQVSLRDGAQRYVRVRIYRVPFSPYPAFPSFYHRIFTKQTAGAEAFADSVHTSTGRPTPGFLHLVQGRQGGEREPTSVVVHLNGEQKYFYLLRSPCSPATACMVQDPLRRDSIPVSLLGRNELRVEVQGSAGSQVGIWLEAEDSAGPRIVLDAPAAGLITRGPSVTVTGTVVDESPPVVLTVNGDTVALGAGGSFSRSVALPAEGGNTLLFRARDAKGHATDSLRTVIRDSQGPVLTLSAPAEGAVTGESTVAVQGSVTDATAVTVNVNGVPLAVSGGGFSGTVALAEGSNFLTVSATDQAGNNASVVRQVVLDTQAPAITITSPAEGEATAAASIQVTGVVQDATAVTLAVNGAVASVGAGGAFSHEVALTEGSNTISVAATDAAGRTAAATRTVTRTGPSQNLPPDPSTVAPRLDRTVATTLESSTSFLYSGASPIQTGVAPGTINPVRVAVLRGKVLARSGQPLGGVRVAVKDRPEFGETLSRADGAFDLAVNGGGVLTVQYDKAGHLPAQRQVNAPWQYYVRLEDVVLVGLDPSVTTVALSGAATGTQVARGSVVQDADGPRQATLIFDPGTTATLQMPDGSTQAVTSLRIRATEYTVGDSGPRAMPAMLPPTTAYTYAVELSADEAIAAGATGVGFSKPVALYVENFLGFPVGTPVPVGFYDTRKAAWVPADNGRVIKILDVGGGIAAVDANGDGVADDAPALEALGIDPAEQARLAHLYAAGTTLWRVQVTHFSIWDLNWGAILDGLLSMLGKGPDDDNREDDPDCQGGSVIECQNQALGERLGLAGTGLSLNYRSTRAPGNVAAFTRTISLTRDTVPATLRRIELEVEVAGQRFTRSFAPAANLSYTYTWDGRDGFGRPVQGEQPATIRIGYVYPQYYSVPASTARSFGLSCTGSPTSTGWQACVIPSTISGRARQEGTRWFEEVVQLGTFDARAQEMGGWTLGVHHAYDPAGKVLHLGDGRKRSAADMRLTATRVAGYWSVFGGVGSDGVPATHTLTTPRAIAVDPEGSFYIAEHSEVKRVGADGIIRRVVGNQTMSIPCGGDGGPARSAQLCNPVGLAFGAEGSLYIATSMDHRIRRVRPDSIITTVVGTGTAGFSGDGGPAAQAQLNVPADVAVGPDGSIYIADQNNRRVRRVAPDGIISTIAGNGRSCWENSAWVSDPSCGDELLATQARLTKPKALALGPDGSLYITDDQRIRRLTPGGMLTTVAGTLRGDCYYNPPQCADGRKATDTYLYNPDKIAVDAEGVIYVADNGNSKVRSVGLDGIVRRVAGGGSGYTDGGLATDWSLRHPAAVALGPGGVLYTASNFDYYTIRVSLGLPGFSSRDIVLYGEDGREIYQFDAAGRHLRTLDALTKAALYEFSYDAGGKLSAVRNGDGLTTRIERSGSGAPAAVVSPYGHRTTLSVDGAGYLDAVTNPASHTVRLGYAPGGMLTGMQDPRGNAHTYVYDALGRLTRDEDAAGGFKSLVRSENGTGYSVALSTAMGRTNTYRVEELAAGDQRRVNTDPAGLRTVITRGIGGTSTTTSPDGMVVTMTEGADPRFGMQAPVLSRFSAKTPGGVTFNASLTRTVTLSQPGNPLSLSEQKDELTVNGKVLTRTYNAALRQFSTVTPENRQRVTRIDSLGRVVEAQVAGVAAAKYTYDAQGRLKAATRGGRTWTYGYDGNGRLATKTDPLLRTERYFYNDADQLERQVLPDGREIRYAYDPNGNLISLTPPGRPAHSFGYTSTDLAEGYRPPLLGGDSTITRYRYNLDRQIERVTRPDGTAVDFGYDGAGRLASISTPVGLLSYNYDSTTGNLAGVVAPGGSTLLFSYNGSLVTGVTWAGAVAGSVGVSYNSDFRINAQTVNGRDTIQFAYDRDGLLTGAGALGITRNAQNGLTTGTTLGGVTQRLAYGVLGELEGDSVGIGSTALLQRSYTRDDLGRITGLSETVGGQTSAYAFAYDSIGQLREVKRDGAVVESYEYDANGNRERFTGPGGVLVGSYDAQDRLLQYGDAVYAYTANGELREKVVGIDTTRYVYDAIGNLRTVVLADGTRTEYLIDGQSRRIGKRVNGALVQGLLYAGQLNPVAELNGSGQVVSRFVYGTKANVPDYMTTGGKTYRIVSDHLGSVRLVVDASTGQVAQRIDYDAFGRVTQNTNPGFQPFGYAGGLMDEQTGLIRFGARDYDARAGRWMAKDPVGFMGGDGSLYAYGGNDPVNRMDPTGLVWDKSQYCQSLLTKIGNIQNEIQKREGEMREDPLGLPGKCAGDDKKPSLSKRGHRNIIDRLKGELARRQAEYLAYCGQTPPVGAPDPAAEENPNWFDKKYWEEMTGLTGGALVLYLIVSEGSRVVPVRNAIPVP